MAYVICEPCVDVKDTACIDVCPVDCIHPSNDFPELFDIEKQLYIDPEECIDCGVCEPECPIDAIKADTDESVENMEKWLEVNKKFSTLWPNISKKKEPMKDHEKFKDLKNKFDEHFSDKPGP